MMRTTILVTAVLLLMLSASAVYAQRVESTLDNGNPVINCDGLPSSMYTLTAKGSTEEALKTAPANEKVYKRFAVSNSDNSTSSNWYTAFTVCSGASGDSWRLPTQRELMLMWVLKHELAATGASGFIRFSDYSYWSATEVTIVTSWDVNFRNGYTGSTHYKEGDCRVRCVREL